MSVETPRNGLFLSDINPLYRASVGILATIIGEQTKGKNKKRQLREQFREYCRLLEIQLGSKGRGFSIIVNSVFLYFPSVRDFLYKLNPGIANF